MHLAYDLGPSRAFYWGPLIIGVFDTMIDGPGIQKFRELHRVLLPVVGRFSTINFVAGELEMRVDAEVRRVGAEMTREFQPTAVAGATVLRSGGIKAAFARSVITGMHLLGRSTTPHRVFATVADALDWILAVEGQEARIISEGEAIKAAVMAKRW